MKAAITEDIGARRPVEVPHLESVVAQRRDATRGSSARALLWKVWLPIPILFLILDVTFGLYFWKIPKLTGRSADYGYQFLLDVHRLHQPKPPGSVRVVALGSSVSGSFDPYQVEDLLTVADPALAVHVHRLLLPGIKPSDYRTFFAAEREAIQPDVAVLVLNLVDFLNPSFERDVKEQMRYVLPPWEMLRERGAYMPVSGRVDLALAGVSDLYRYRKPIRSALRDHVKLAVQRLRARGARGAYGVFGDGYTKQHFGIAVAGAAAMDLEYYIDPEWLRQRGRVRLRFAQTGQALAERVETEPGWKSINLTPRSGAAPVLDVDADSAWTPRASGSNDDSRLLGVRLRQAAVSSPSGGSAPLRYPPIDDRQLDAFMRMGDVTGERFAANWQAMLEANSGFAKRFRRYRELKVGLRDQPFEAGGEYAELERLVRDLTQHGVAVVLVNSPESPWILKDYQDGPYYRGYLQFFDHLARQYPRVSFHDARSVLPADDFNDWHHANYIGVIKMGPLYAHWVESALAAPMDTRGS